MSDRIGGRTGGPTEFISPTAADKTAAGAPAGPEPGASSAEVKDAFERQKSSVAGQALQSRLQGASPKTTAQLAKLQFTSADLAYLAQTFSGLMAQNVGANRLKRARLFARAILKRSRIRHMFAGVSESELEHMCDAIADALDDSPVFGQLVDNVSEGTGKING